MPRAMRPDRPSAKEKARLVKGSGAVLDIGLASHDCHSGESKRPADALPIAASERFHAHRCLKEKCSWHEKRPLVLLHSNPTLS